MQRFLIQAKEDGFYEMMLLELATGMRRGEICALQWDDLNLRTGELHIQRQVIHVAGALHVSSPKTKSSDRVVILPPAVLAVLRELKERTDSRWMVSLAGKRRRSAGSAERLSKDEKSIGAGAVQGHPLPRPAPYLSHHRAGARYGRENALHHHRTYLLGDYHRYLQPHHRRHAAAGRAEDRVRHRPQRGVRAPRDARGPTPCRGRKTACAPTVRPVQGQGAQARHRRDLRAQRSPLRGPIFTHQRPGQTRGAHGLCQDEGRMRGAIRNDDRRGAGEDQGGEAASERCLGWVRRCARVNKEKSRSDYNYAVIALRLVQTNPRGVPFSIISTTPSSNMLMQSQLR